MDLSQLLTSTIDFLIKAGLKALGALAIWIVGRWLIGFATNDSGTAIPPSGMLVIAPLVILVAAWQGRSAPKDVLRRQAARRPTETAARQDAPAGSR